MYDKTFFTNPEQDWQRRYEALRASFVEGLPLKEVASRFGYAPSYVRLLRHLFKKGKLDLSEPVAEGKVKRRRVTAQVRQRIRQWRKKNLSAREITERLLEDGVEISVRTTERVLREEGFGKLPRRTPKQAGFVSKATNDPTQAAVVSIGDFEGRRIDSAGAGVFIFAPFIAELGIDKVVRAAGLPSDKVIPATSYLLSYLALKLLGTERYAHVADREFDQGLGLFAGLNTLPKCPAMSTYSYLLDEVHVAEMQAAFIQRCNAMDLYDGRMVYFALKTMPRYNETIIGKKRRVVARDTSSKESLTLFAQDVRTKLIVHVASGIERREVGDQVLSFLTMWSKLSRKAPPILMFDSRFASYKQLARFNEAGAKFITLRRRGQKLLAQTAELENWQPIYLAHENGRFKRQFAHESEVVLRGYSDKLRQIIVQSGRIEQPESILTNDFDAPAERIAGDNASRWQVAQRFARATTFFDLNALSSPILVKEKFDVALTLIADTLYAMLAKRLIGFEHNDPSQLFRHFVHAKGLVQVKNGQVSVTFPRRTHNGVLRKVDWSSLPMRLSGMGRAGLTLKFK